MGNKFGDAYREEQRRIHRKALRPRRPHRERRSQWQPGNNGTVNGVPAEIQHGNTGLVSRVDAYWPAGSSEYGHLVSRDGLNADYLREPGMAHGESVVDLFKDDPYD